MEQIIEFPLEGNAIFEEPFNMVSAYCFCYQHDVDVYGFGPYGFTTPRAEALIFSVLGPLVYWDVVQKELRDSPFPYATGIYFLKNLAGVDQLSAELSTYKQKLLMRSLRARRGQVDAPKEVEVEPLLLRLLKGGILQCRVLSELSEKLAGLFVVHSFGTEYGNALVFFDPSIRTKIKDFSRDNDIFYATCSSAVELKPW